MKIIWLLIAMLGGAAVLVAQTNPPPRTKPERAATVIKSKSMEFQFGTREVTYVGDVRVTDPQMTLTCAVLTARFMTNESQPKIESIVAETNVVIEAIDTEGTTNYASAGKLVYSFSVENGVTNQIIELSGEPRPKVTTSKSGAGLEGEIVRIDLVKGKVFSYDVQTTFKTEGVKSFAEELEGKTKQDKPQ